MAQQSNQEKLPLAHPTVITWMALATIVAMIAAYLLWAILLAGPTIMR